jgi:hypothetical protein
LKTIRTRRQRETDYDTDEKQLLEILLFDGETSGVWLTFWDSEQIKVINLLFKLIFIRLLVCATMDTGRTYSFLCWNSSALR